VILTSRSENFWVGLDREGPYWKLFHTFAAEMRAIAARPVHPKELKF